MFKYLNEFINEYNPEQETINAYINRKNDKNLSLFLVGKEKFAFYEAVLNTAKAIIPDYDTASKDVKDYAFIKAMLSSDYFNFVSLYSTCLRTTGSNFLISIFSGIVRLFLVVV